MSESEFRYSAGEIARTIYMVAAHRPLFTLGIILLSTLVGGLEGIGLGFILPIIEIIQGTTDPANASGPVKIFAQAYQWFGIPFQLQFIVIGVLSVIGVRYLSSFLSEWLTAMLRVQYVQSLRQEAFDNALDARVSYFDSKGSDEILNAIVTQTQYAGRAILSLVRILELLLVSAAYILIAMVVAPRLMVITGVVLGGFMFGIRYVFESGMSVGERVAEANQQVQQAVQAGMQGIREVKLFRLTDELRDEFDDAVNQYTTSKVAQRRNQAGISNFNRFATAGSVFVLIYVGVEFSSLSIGGLGLFLFALFRLGPKLSALNQAYYQLENDMPHLIRTRQFIDRLDTYAEAKGSKPVPADVDEITYDDVSFRYENTNERVLDGVSFTVQRGEFISFVGTSGAGKSTIVSLLGRMYEADEGAVLANGTDITEFDIQEWRSRVAIVRQNPFIFNDTLKYNITVGNRDATDAEIQKVCNIAQVTEFLDELPEGFGTVLGDDGVKLSGGQKQRVAIARALLSDSDILVLDEATSDLDGHLEEQVHRGIEARDQDQIIITIAHRLSTIVNADRIYMMENGRISESGSHDKLIDQDGEYADLFTTQLQTT